MASAIKNAGGNFRQRFLIGAKAGVAVGRQIAARFEMVGDGADEILAGFAFLGAVPNVEIARRAFGQRNWHCDGVGSAIVEVSASDFDGLNAFSAW